MAPHSTQFHVGHVGRFARGGCSRGAFKQVDDLGETHTQGEVESRETQ